MTIEAIKDLFKDVLTFEKDVVVLYNKLMEQLNDPEIRKAISEIIADEERHIRNAKEIISILDS